ncbi:amino acid ABC transporter substrate-binding protein [Mycetocola lacteus]|uniref:Amino acid ABC transporter substrate-binding protein n=1 Tax=Mycetocola lacteus TaxID=76637 RepID=A0A3L7AFI6_9MICO|nr:MULTISPECIES: ABC transporter substrate-binding protein [Mycetocola]MCS4276353.1 polar amino acid transport system substrate-binding protein [Mycetocola sp. BIGb0189]RLP79216.1 amino acid ABC transporter substrate-binding protein [Mycetocola lacteus]
MSRKITLGVIALAAAAALALTGCASGGGNAGDTVTPGKLTIATGEPAYSPWTVDNKPENGEGLEPAVAYAVAEKLGYKKEDVVWVRTTFDGAIAPGPKDFDLNLQQYSATPEREKAVDFSSPYYVTKQSVVTTKSSKFSGAKSLADLKDAHIGVAAGSTALNIVKEEINPSTEVQVFNNTDDLAAAVNNGQIDALVTDVPTAFYIIDSEQVKDGVNVGQIDTTKGGDELSILLPKNSALTKKVTEAVDELRKDGSLDKFAQKWIADKGAPVLPKK